MSILMEGGLLTLVGSLIGLLMGHSVLFILSNILEQTQKAGITGLIFYSQEWIILAGSLILGVLCSLIPAIQAYKTDISTVLSGN
jgi:putative ABC transport system permease protein